MLNAPHSQGNDARERPHTTVIASEREAIQSHAHDSGLLRRGACHRATLRADPLALRNDSRELSPHPRDGIRPGLRTPYSDGQISWYPANLANARHPRLDEQGAMAFAIELSAVIARLDDRVIQCAAASRLTLNCLCNTGSSAFADDNSVPQPMNSIRKPRPLPRPLRAG